MPADGQPMTGAPTIFVALAAAVVLAHVAGSGPHAQAAPPREHSGSLVSVTARSMTVVRNRDGSHTLVLRGTSSSVPRLSEAPARPRAGDLTLDDLTAAWASWVPGRGARAIAVQAGAGPNRRARAMRLQRPSWDDKQRELRFQATPLVGPVRGLRPLGARRAAFRAGPIGPATVTIELPRGRVIDGCWIGPGARCVGRDLSGAGLGKAQMRGVVMPVANIEEARFARADLRGAILPRTRARGLRAPGAQLAGAILASSDLRGAVLVGADLTDAVLAASDLTGADLRGAKTDGLVLARTRQCGTVLPDGTRSDRDCGGP